MFNMLNTLLSDGIKLKGLIGVIVPKLEILTGNQKWKSVKFPSFLVIVGNELELEPYTVRKVYEPSFKCR